MSNHLASSDDKLAIMEQMTDPRARQLGRRLLFNEWPGVLNSDERREIQHGARERLSTQNSVPWMTIQKALDEIAEFRMSHDSAASEILDNYEQYLLGYQVSPIAAE